MEGNRIIDPMAYSCDILLGRIIKPAGYDGAVTVKLESSFVENIPELESVFLEIEGRPVPFFIYSVEYKGGNMLTVRFKDYDSVTKVSEFRACRVFLTGGGKGFTVQEESYEFTGYKVFSQENIQIGHVTEIIRNPAQWLVKVSSPSKGEVLIPFHEDLILLIDERKKILKMELPDGLMEIN